MVRLKWDKPLCTSHLLFTVWHFKISAVTLSSSCGCSPRSTINMLGPNVTNPEGEADPNKPQVSIFKQPEKEDVKVWIKSLPSDVCFVYILFPLVFLWGRLEMVIMSRRAMSLTAQAGGGLASRVFVKPTQRCGCLYERPNQFWSWYVGKINETSNKVK